MATLMEALAELLLVSHESETVLVLSFVTVRDEEIVAVGEIIAEAPEREIVFENDLVAENSSLAVCERPMESAFVRDVLDENMGVGLRVGLAELVGVSVLEWVTVSSGDGVRVGRSVLVDVNRSVSVPEIGLLLDDVSEGEGDAEFDIRLRDRDRVEV